MGARKADKRVCQPRQDDNWSGMHGVSWRTSGGGGDTVLYCRVDQGAGRAGNNTCMHANPLMNGPMMIQMHGGMISLRICIPRPAKAILTRIDLGGDHCRQDWSSFWVLAIVFLVN
jgi:hypothetical protein